MDNYPEKGPSEDDEVDIIYVDVPDENEPIIASGAEVALGLFAIYDTLRKGGDVTTPVGIVFRNKNLKEK